MGDCNIGQKVVSIGCAYLAGEITFEESIELAYALIEEEVNKEVLEMIKWSLLLQMY